MLYLRKLFKHEISKIIFKILTYWVLWESVNYWVQSSKHWSKHDGSGKDQLGDNKMQNYKVQMCQALGSGFAYIVGTKCPYRNSKTRNHLYCEDQPKVPTRKMTY